MPSRAKRTPPKTLLFLIALPLLTLPTRGGVEDTRLEAKDTKKIRGQGQPFRGQTLSRPRTGMLDQGHKRKCSPKKKVFTKIFQAISQKKKKVFTKIFQAISTKKRFLKNSSSAPQNFNYSKSTAVLKPRTGQFSRTSGLEAKDLTFKAKDFKMCTRGLHLCCQPLCLLSSLTSISSDTPFLAQS